MRHPLVAWLAAPALLLAACGPLEGEEYPADPAEELPGVLPDVAEPTPPGPDGAELLRLSDGPGVDRARDQKLPSDKDPAP